MRQTESGDVEIKGRIVRDDPEEMFILFRPKAPGFVAAVALPRSRIAVVREPGEWVTVTMPLAMAEEKGLGEFAK